MYCDIRVTCKRISYCMAWLQLHFISLLFLFIFPYRFSTLFRAKFILRLVLYVWIHHFHITHSSLCLPTKMWLNYSFHFLLGITVFPREIEKHILGGKRGYMAKVKKVNKYELLTNYSVYHIWDKRSWLLLSCRSFIFRTNTTYSSYTLYL